MAKHRKKSNTKALIDAVSGVAALDSFQNVFARTGNGMPNLMNGTNYPLTRLTKDYNLMTSLYRNNWLARRIVDLIPKDMLKNGWRYESDLTPEQTDKLYKMERLTKLNASLLQGLNWGRLYGGAAGLMMIEGQDTPEKLAEPLDLDAILPGDFKGLLIVDRWSGVSPMLELVEDINSPDFGLPSIYRFTDYPQKTNFEVHHSRIIRFTGDDLPEWEKQAESYWGASVLESCYEELKKRDNTSANIAGLVFLANLRILKMEDLGELLASTPADVQRNFYNVVQAQNWLQNNFGVQVLSRDDDFQQFQLNNFNGLNDIYESFMLDVSGAAQIPVTKLFGRSPAGMNATGESDMRNYYDVVEGYQETHLRPQLEKLLPVLCLSALGTMPDDMQIVFNPVETPSEEKMAEAVRWRSDTIFQAHDRALISDRVALQELKQMGDGMGIFTNITDENIANASDEPKDQLEMEMPSGSKSYTGSDDDEKPKRWIEEYTNEKGEVVPAHWR